MARTIAIWGPTGLATPTCKLMLRTALTSVVETITLTEHGTVKRLYTGTVTAAAGQYRHNFLTAGSFIGGGSVAIGATDATTYEEDNSLDWGGIVGQTATVALSGTTVGTVTTLTDLTAAQAEPGQGTPAVNASVLGKISYLYKAWRNRSSQTATAYKLYGDDAATVDQKAAVSDDGTTFESGEKATGP